MLRSLAAIALVYAMVLFGLQPGAFAQFTPAYNGGTQSAPYPTGAPYGDPQSYPPLDPYGQTPNGYAPQYAGSGQYPAPDSEPNMQPDVGNPGVGDPGTDQQHGVARLSIVQGDVNVRRGDNGQMVAAIVNAPVMAQDRVQTSPGSRAEVQFDYANVARLAPNTDLGIAGLELGRYQMQLGAGTIIYRVLRGPVAQSQSAQVEIDTPSVAFRPTSEGEFRLSVLDDGTTQITVRSGSGQILSPRGSEQLTAGRSTLVRGNPQDPEFQSTYEIARDQFDDWSANRDRELLASQSYKYVSPDEYGADDLDAYGKWVPSQYGQVWAPQPPTADWAPYSYGQWDYEPYYGWTWVDYAPWGWAPYHYGRWFYNGGYGWCWSPGAFGGRYSWSPALVSFFGLGAGLGWVALAPFEPFFGWWGRWGRGGYGGFGVYRGLNVAAMYRNAGFRGGAVYAGYNGFGGPHGRFGFASREQLINANAYRGQVPANPTRNSFQFSARQASVNPRLASVPNRQFFHANFSNGRAVGGGFVPAAGTRFAQNGFTQSRAQQNNSAQRNYAPGNYPQNQASRYGGQGQGTPRSSAPSTGWGRFGDPGSGSTYRQNFAGPGTSPPQPRAGNESGWHTFGQAERPPAQGYNSYRGGAPQGNYSRELSPQARPGNGYMNGFAGGSNYAAPRYSAPAQPRYNAPPAQQRFSAPQPRYSAPSAQHFTAPSSRGGGGGGGEHGNGGGHSGGGGRRR